MLWVHNHLQTFNKANNDFNSHMLLNPQKTPFVSNIQWVNMSKYSKGAPCSHLFLFKCIFRFVAQTISCRRFDSSFEGGNLTLLLFRTTLLRILRSLKLLSVSVDLLNRARVPLQVILCRVRRRSLLLCLARVAGQGFPSPTNRRTKIVLDVGLPQQLLEDGQYSFVVFGWAFCVTATPLQGGLRSGHIHRYLAVLLLHVALVADNYDGDKQTACFDNLKERRRLLKCIGKPLNKAINV